jgi:hypothetical protein
MKSYSYTNTLIQQFPRGGFHQKNRTTFLLQLNCVKVMLGILMKFFLSICCLVLCMGLTISAVSPDFHSFFFHSSKDCPHSNKSTPCHSHEDEEEGNEGSSCPVLLFNKSSQFSHFPVFLSQAALSVVELYFEDRESAWFCRKTISVWARGPPLRA